MNSIREKSQDFSGCGLDFERHLLVTHAGPLRRRSGPRAGPMLDRLQSSMAMATRPDAGCRFITRSARSSHLCLLYCHREDHLGPVGSPYLIHPVSQSKQQQHGR